MSIEISVVAPFFNERENLISLVERLNQVFLQRKLVGEIILIDDCSTDDSIEVAEELVKKNTNVVLLRHSINQGIAAGWISGTRAAKGKFVCLIDSDLQYLPEEVWRLYSTIKKTNADMVQGVRSTIGRLKDARYLYSKGLNSILNILFGMRLRDNKSGFVIAQREALKDILEHKGKYFYFNTFIAIAAHAKGYTVAEVETLFQSRRIGTSYINKYPLLLIAKVFIDIFKGIFEYRLHRDRYDLHFSFIKRSPISREVETYQGWRKLWLKAYFLTTPLHKWLLTRNSEHYYNFLNQSQWLSNTKIKELQLLKLQRLLRHAYNHVPYYRELFDSIQLSPSDISSLEDIQKIPTLSKDAVRKNLHFDLFAENHQKKEMLKIRTSGSTGEPFVTYADRKQLEFRWAATLRSAEWTGWRFGDRQVRLWHQTLGMSWSQVAREFVDAWFMRRLFIPAYELSDHNIKQFVEKIVSHNPVLVDGYAESFNFLAHYLKDHNIPSFKPKAIMTSAQVMPKQVRQVIEGQLGAKVFDKYGSREFSGIAYECDQHDGHHIVAEAYIVELLKDGRPALPGEVGEVVITDLNNYSVPLIRYRIGDLAVAMDDAQPCACGRGLPRIGQIEGRSQAIVLCSSGRWLPGTFFAHFFKDYDYAVRQYQIVQHSRERLEIKIVPDNLYSQEVMTEMKNHLAEYTGKDMELDFVEVGEIPLLATGKRTAIISHLKFDFQKLADEPN